MYRRLLGSWLQHLPGPWRQGGFPPVYTDPVLTAPPSARVCSSESFSRTGAPESEHWDLGPSRVPGVQPALGRCSLGMEDLPGCAVGFSSRSLPSKPRDTRRTLVTRSPRVRVCVCARARLLPRPLLGRKLLEGLTRSVHLDVPVTVQRATSRSMRFSNPASPQGRCGIVSRTVRNCIRRCRSHTAGHSAVLPRPAKCIRTAPSIRMHTRTHARTLVHTHAHS